MDPFYRIDGDRLVATEHTRGPWDDRFQHAGPPSALLGRALEREARARGVPFVARLTIELLRPIPIGALEIASEPSWREGKNVASLVCRMTHEGREVARALALCIRERELDEVPPPDAGPPPPPESGPQFTFPFFLSEVGYHHAVELRIVEGDFGRTPTTAWLRARGPLVEGEPMSPLCRVLVAADSGNGTSPVLDWKRYSFVNADLTVALHRLPAGEWVCLKAETVAGSKGVGLAHSRLFDRAGPLGHALQSLVVAPRESS